MSLSSVFNIAGSGMSAQSIRLATVASNLSNANSVASNPEQVYRSRQPVFRAAKTDFDTLFHEAKVGVRVEGIVTSNAPAIRRYEPNHPLANRDGYIYASNVNALDEMANMISASRSYQMNAEVINTTKRLMLQALNIGK
ncbi:MAG: flagellar basal body rod protein FlgC [Gammaproteobacteria bacterium]